MTVSEIIVTFEMNRWHRFLFWSVNIPRYLMGMDLVVYRCMFNSSLADGFKRATIKLGED